MFYKTKATIGSKYVPSNPSDSWNGEAIEVEAIDTKFGTVRFTNGWFISSAAFDTSYELATDESPEFDEWFDVTDFVEAIAEEGRTDFEEAVIAAWSRTVDVFTIADIESDASDYLALFKKELEANMATQEQLKELRFDAAEAEKRIANSQTFLERREAKAKYEAIKADCVILEARIVTQEQLKENMATDAQEDWSAAIEEEQNGWHQL